MIKQKTFINDLFLSKDRTLANSSSDVLMNTDSTKYVIMKKKTNLKKSESRGPRVRTDNRMLENDIKDQEPRKTSISRKI